MPGAGGVNGDVLADEGTIAGHPLAIEVPIGAAAVILPHHQVLVIIREAICGLSWSPGCDVIEGELHLRSMAYKSILRILQFKCVLSNPYILIKTRWIILSVYAH